MNDQYIKEDILLDEDDHIIDIAASFSCEHQDDEYNKAYKKWRSDKNNVYAYNYVKDTREHTYLDGVGFINQNPAATEKKSLSKNMEVIGIILIITFLIEILGQYVYVKLASFFGCYGEYDLINGISNASDCYVVLSSYLVQIIGRVVPILLLFYFMKLPKAVLFPTKILNKDSHLISVPFLMVITVLCNYCFTAYDKLLGFFNIEVNIVSFFMPKTLEMNVLVILLNVIIVPVLSEILLRGVIMQSLRQFGNGFALLTTSIISAMMYHAMSQAFYAFILSLIIGYFVLRTGSLLTGMLMHIVAIASIFGYSLLDFYCKPIEVTFIWSVIQFFCILIGLIAILGYIYNKKSLLVLNMQQTYVSTKEKLLTSLVSFPIMSWIVLGFVKTLISIKFKE